MDFPEFYEISEVIDVSDPEDVGRAKVKFLRTGLEPDIWIPLKSSVYGQATDGWHSSMAKGDIVLVAFVDYPNKQKPFIDGKLQTKNESVSRNNTAILKSKDHTITFSDDKIELKNKNGSTILVIENGKIKISATSIANYSSIRGELLEAWLKTHVHIDSMGFPTLTTDLSLFPWNDLIENKNILVD